METLPKIALLLGSESDWAVMQACAERLTELQVPFEVQIMSAHRTPDDVDAFVREAPERGVAVFIAAAGMSAALAGVVAARTPLPVIGVPMDSGPLRGIDALLSTVQMPPGVPVGGMAIGNAGAVNAAIYAARILALSDPALGTRLEQFRSAQADKVRKARDKFAAGSAALE